MITARCLLALTVALVAATASPAQIVVIGGSGSSGGYYSTRASRLTVSYGTGSANGYVIRSYYSPAWPYYSSGYTVRIRQVALLALPTATLVAVPIIIQQPVPTDTARGQPRTTDAPAPRRNSIPPPFDKPPQSERPLRGPMPREEKDEPDAQAPPARPNVPAVPDVPAPQPQPAAPARPDLPAIPPRPAKPPSPESLVDRGRVAFANGEHRRALDFFRRAAETAPNDPLPQFLIGQAYLALGKYLEAVEAIEAGMALRRDWPSAPFQPRELYGPRPAEYAEAKEQLRDALAHHPDDPILLFLLAHQLWFDGQQAEARRLFERARPHFSTRHLIDRFLQPAISLQRPAVGLQRV